MAEETERRPSDPGSGAPFSRRRRKFRAAPWGVWPAVSLGGALGGLARHWLNLAIPHDPGVFVWSTFLANLSGCFLIGILMVLVTDVVSRPRLLRPFLGVGVLGGYTTFSTHIGVAQVHIDAAQQLLIPGSAGFALAYMVGTAVGALVAVWTGVRMTRAVFCPRFAARGGGGG